MIVEHFRGDPVVVYRRFRDQGRLAPDGLHSVGSWVTSDLQRCYRIMECDDRGLLEDGSVEGPRRLRSRLCHDLDRRHLDDRASAVSPSNPNVAARRA